MFTHLVRRLTSLLLRLVEVLAVNYIQRDDQEKDHDNDGVPDGLDPSPFFCRASSRGKNLNFWRQP